MMDGIDKIFVGAWFAMAVLCLAAWAGMAYVVYAVLSHFQII